MTGFVWGTVISSGVSFRVRLDGDTDPLPHTPATLVDPLSLAVGNRVRCEMSRRRVIIHGKSGGESVAADALASVFPVGAVYLSTSPTNPAALFGGTWTAIAQGRALVGVDPAQPEFNAVRKTGGAKTVTLTDTQLPNFSLDIAEENGVYRPQPVNNATATGGTGFYQRAQGAHSSTSLVATHTGGGQPVNTLSPFFTVFAWERTA